MLVVISCVFVLKQPVAFANSAEPPAVMIIIEGATDETQVALVSGDKRYVAKHVTDKVFEKQYAFYYHEIIWPWNEKMHLEVISGDEQLDFDFPNAMDQYRNLYTVNLKSGNLLEGVTFWRQIKWVLRRVSVTIAIEALVFLAFGYRERRTFIIFLVMNLITQGYLNVTLSGIGMGAYVLLGLIVLEILVLITELIIGLIAIREHKRWRTALCIFVCNVVSFFVGGAMLMMLPA